MLCGDTDGSWRPLVEYSLKKGVSLSTLRRYIKAGKLQYRVENGRYLLFDGDSSGALAAASGAVGAPLSAGTAPEATQLGSETDRLRIELKRAREEIAELKTLIAFYEEQPQGASY
jgi:hypothetical protein